MRPGSPEWHARVAELKALEAAQPAQWWWLSFSSPDKWLGGCFVWAQGFTTALDRAIGLGINPGGEVKCEPVGILPPDDMPVNELITSPDEMEEW